VDRPRLSRLVGVVAAVLAVAFVTAGVATEASGDQRVADSATPPGATTAVLSARRSPDLVGRATAGRRLDAAMAPLLAAAPDDRCVSATQGGQRIVDDHGDRALIPASNLKLLTGLAALTELGPDTTFSTVVAARKGPDSSGTVTGDVWFIGAGDPLIVTDPYRATNKFGPDVPHTSLEAIADAVVAAGVKHIDGRIVGDESRYDTVRTVPSWPDRYLAEAQVGPLSALSVNDARTAPATADEDGPTAPSRDPARYAATALRSLLVARGVTVAGDAATGQSPTSRTTLVSMPSVPVKDVVREMLSFSDNNTAELMLKELDVHHGGKGTTAGGVAVVADVLSRRRIPADGLVMVDGSGLDRSDRVSCRTLVAVLADQGASGDLAAGLSTANDVGTLFDRFVNSPAKGRVRGKTGTLNDVSSLSGWARTTADLDVSFSMLFNGRRVTAAEERLEERIAEALLSYPDGPDPAVIGPEHPT